MGPSSELTSCLLPDVTVELAQKTPIKQSLATTNPRGSTFAFCTFFILYFFLAVFVRKKNIYPKTCVVFYRR